MPETIIAAIGIIGSVASTAGPAALGLTGTSAALFSAGVSIGTSALSMLAKDIFAGEVPDSNIGLTHTITTEPPIGPRFAVVGRHRVGGYRIFRDVNPKNDHLWQVVMLQARETDSFVTHYLDNRAVTLDGSGWVQTPAKWKDKVRIFTKDGSHSTAFSGMTSAFPSEWTSNHVGNGMTLVAIQQKPVGPRALRSTYPNGILSYSATIDGVKVPAWNAYKAADWTYSSNAARVVLWHLLDAEAGYGLWRGDINLNSFRLHQILCSQSVSLSGGGTESRYTTHGIISYDRPRVDTLRDLLRNCDADLRLDADGLLEIVPLHQVQDHVLTDDKVVAFVMARGIPEEQRVNSVVANYVEPGLAYQPNTAPAKQFTLAAGEARNVRQLALPYCRSGTQAQRLAKRELYRLNPLATGKVVCPIEAVEWQVGDYVDWQLSNNLVTNDFRIHRKEISPDGATVILHVDAYPNSMVTWDAASDESDAGVGTPTDLSDQEFVNWELPAGRVNLSEWRPAGNSTTITAEGDIALSVVGTATAATIATTNLHTLAKRLEALDTTPSTSAVAGFYHTQKMWGLSSTADQGGFLFVCRWGPATGVSNTTKRMFVGLQDVVTAPTDVAINNLTNCMGFGWGSSASTIQFHHNDGTGSTTTVNLDSTDFPRPTADRTEIYECIIYAKPGEASQVDWEFRNLATGAVETGTATTNLPASGTLLAPRIWASVGSTSAVAGVALMNLSIQSEA